MQKNLSKIRDEFKEECLSSSSTEELNKLKIKYLGRKGKVTLEFKTIGSLSPEERPGFGKLCNEIKQEIESLLKERLEHLKPIQSLESVSGPDLSLPGRRFHSGKLHPITKVMEEMCSIFKYMGFAVAEGPEIELDFYNFEALNIPPDHPARDMQDTFYVDENTMLRTHTSPIQIRTMEKCRPPLRIIAPGKVYRCDSDITHTPMFHQVEGLMVDRNVSFSDLKGILTSFLHHVFDPETSVRFRPSFFPFTEPSAEVDIQCVNCRGEGCRVCSRTGWLEVLGAGMVHPQVFRHVGYDTEEFSGLAFGIGVERIAMLKYGISDIRLFYENNVRFLDQF